MISLKLILQASSKAPRKMAKVSAGKKAAAASKVGKKVSSKKTAVASKKPAPKSNRPAPKSDKGVSGKAKAGKSSKNTALKVNKAKAMKK